MPVQVLVVIGFGVLVLAAASTRIDWSVTNRFNPLDGVRAYSPTPLPAASPPDLEQPEVTTLPWAGPVFWTLLAVVAVVLVAVLARLLWRARPRRRVQVMTTAPPAPSGAVSVEERAAALRRGAMTAMELLDEIPDPQDAVIRSWLALERAADSSGAPRSPADSPTEFARRLLTATGADTDAVRKLLFLYHRARFSGHPVGLPQVIQARACVASLSRSLAGYESALRRSVEIGSRVGLDRARDPEGGSR